MKHEPAQLVFNGLFSPFFSTITIFYAPYHSYPFSFSS